jgi:PAS domain S-box-containing protein
MQAPILPKAKKPSGTVVGQVKRSFLVINITIAVFFVIYFFQAYFLYKRSGVSDALLSHTNEMLSAIKSADANTEKADASLMAFLATRDNAYKLKFNEDVAALRVDIANLVWLASVSKVGEEKMLDFSRLVDQKITLSESMLAGNDKIHLQPSDLKSLTDNIEEYLNQIEKEQLHLLSVRTQKNVYYNKARAVFSILSYVLISAFLIIAFYKINHNLRKRTAAEEAMEVERKKQQQLIQGIVDNIPSVIYVKDLDGKYLLVNKKMEEFNALPAEKILGYSDRDLNDDTEKYLAIKHSDHKVLEYRTFTTSEEQKEIDGKMHYFLVTKFPLFDEHGEVKNICGLATDITDMKENELKVLEAKKDAEKAKAAQETFLANMSHEIRTPMNGILGMGNLLLGTPLNQEQQEFTQNIQESARNLLSIINDILDFSKIKSGKFRFDQTRFDVKQTVTRAVYPLRIKANEKLLRLNLQVDDSVPEIAIGDPVRLQQIIINLAGNAIKFTSKGSVDIHIQGVELNDNPAIRIDVKDSGIGIAQHKLDYIFESFTQNNVNTSRKYGGTGLGLAIVKQLTELQNGRVFVESTLGLGSTFTVILPYQLADDADFKESYANTNRAIQVDVLDGIKILVAEDNLINQKVVRSTLQKQGAEVKIVMNGKEAVEQMKDETFDVVLMDLQMPEVDGYKATRYIRNVLKKDVPILAMTADALKGEAEKCFEAGMTGFISKPFEPNDLYLQILKVTKDKELHISEDIKTANMSQPLVDFSFLYEISDNDPAYINEVINLFLGTMPEGLEKLDSVIRTTDDWEAIYKQAHFLKSSVSVVRVRDMFDNLAKIEALAKAHGNKEEIIALLDTIQTTFKEAHPVVLAEQAKHATA